MKKIYLALFTSLVLLFAVSCDSSLPFPTDGIQRGVIIDITRTSGTNAVLYSGQTDGDFKVTLTIPTQQGDYSFMKQAQLLAVLERVLPDPTVENPSRTKTVTESKVIADNITQFPSTVNINMEEVYTLFGLDAPEIGETLYLTTNVVLDNETVIPGWTKSTGYNNKAFTGWRIDGRAYSYFVRYSVVCELVLDDFVGTNTVTVDDWWGETPYEVEVTKISDTELSIAGLFNGEATNPLVITVDPVDYSISFDRQILAPNSGSWWGNPAYNNFAFGNGVGIVNACDTQISFEATGHVDAGNFAGVNRVVLGK